MFGSNQEIKEWELDSVGEWREELVISSEENGPNIKAFHLLKPDGPMLFVLLLGNAHNFAMSLS